ncbi:metallophosphoesterase family protein [Halegenticoccus tardaugens]|uniref:metallophosphoesterase family protein n=1 Tax=Halegenticoccus tardaugens TaxID=2071624 RepID=UPI00100A53BA|nr:metallophosphoesterase [Halegenticoccus tardaugens]
MDRFDEELVLARLSRPRAEETTFAVVSDAHVTPDAAETWKVFHRTERRLRTVVEDANRLGADGLVFAGDLTKDGAPEEFDLVDEILADLDVPLAGVPGNHDAPKEFDPHETPSLDAFAERYAPGSLPYRTTLGGVDLVGLNSAAADDGSLAATHAGRISDSQLSWLDRRVDPETPTVAVFHHPLSHLSDLVPEFRPESHFQLENAAEVGELLAAKDVDLVVSGHVHWPTVARAHGVTQVTTAAACSLPQAYLLVRVEPTGTTVSMVPLSDAAGFEEAYEYARADTGRDGALVACVDGGYFDDCPLVDEREPAGGAAPATDAPGVLYR